MRISIILFNVVLLILLFVLIYLFININYEKTHEKFTTEAAAFLSNTQSNQNTNDQSIVNTTYNTTQFTTDSIDMELQETIQVDTLGNGPAAAFDSVVDIMCQNRIVRLRGPTAGLSYPNGYYWIQTASGPKLTYLITDEEVYGGGWLLAMRAVLGSQVFNVVENINYRDWLDTGATINSTSARLLSLPLRGTQSGYNPSIGLNRFNRDYSDEFNTSSVGSKIFDALIPPISNGTNIFNISETTVFSAAYSEFDCKFPIFRIYLLKEILCIFYYIKNDSFVTIKTYIKIPNRDLDNVSTLHRTLKMPNATMTTINNFRTDTNSDLIYNFKMNIYNINGSPPVSTTTSIGAAFSLNSAPAATINCLLGCHGTIPAEGQTPRLRYLFAVGAALQGNRNRITSSAILITVPDEITATNPIKYMPCGFEIFVK